MIRQQGLDTAIEIDGRVSKETIRKFAPTTVDMFVAGSMCISGESPSLGLGELVELRRSLVAATPSSIAS